MSEYRMLKDVEAAIDIALDRFGLPNDEAVRGRLHNQVGALPSADVVEVVRCKDCRYWHPDINLCTQWGELNDEDILPHAYCSFGERKDGDKE